MSSLPSLLKQSSSDFTANLCRRCQAHHRNDQAAPTSHGEHQPKPPYHRFLLVVGTNTPRERLQRVIVAELHHTPSTKQLRLHLAETNKAVGRLLQSKKQIQQGKGLADHSWPIERRCEGRGPGANANSTIGHVHERFSKRHSQQRRDVNRHCRLLGTGQGFHPEQSGKRRRGNTS